MLRDKGDKLRKNLHHCAASGDAIASDRHEFLAQFDADFMELLLSLVELCLDCVVLHVELVENRCAFGIRLVGE